MPAKSRFKAILRQTLESDHENELLRFREFFCWFVLPEENERFGDRLSAGRIDICQIVDEVNVGIFLANRLQHQGQRAL